MNTIKIGSINFSQDFFMHEDVEYVQKMVDEAIKDVVDTERDRIISGINNLSWDRNNNGVTEIEGNVPYIKVDEAILTVKK